MRLRRRSVGVGLLVVLGLLVFVVPFVAPDPNATDYAGKLAGPSWDHPLGTDQAGRDVLARLAAGARISLGIALLVGALSFVVGIAVGLVAGTASGTVDGVLSRLVDLALAVPHLLLALGIVGALGPGLANLVIAMTLASWAPIARYTRTFARGQLREPYVVAALMSGVPRWRAAVRHVVPATMGTVSAVATLGLGEIVLGLSGLSFLGLGVTPPTAEWGQLVSEGRWYADQAPWLVLAPGVAIVLSVACASLLGDERTEVRRLEQP